MITGIPALIYAKQTEVRLHATMVDLQQRGVAFSQPVAEQSWGLVTSIRLPDGTELGLYGPRHPSPRM